MGWYGWLVWQSLVCGQLQAPPLHFMGATPIVAYRFGAADDHDLDEQPDGWTRRHNDQFPRYVKAILDHDIGAHAPGSLRFTVNGGPAAYYSPLIDVEPAHSLAIRGKIRTRGLENSAGQVTASILNAKRERLLRVDAAPVSGTTEGWADVRIDSFELPAEACFVVLGCHVVDGAAKDVRGEVWFDDLEVFRLPRVHVAMPSLLTHRDAAPLPLRVGGLEAGKAYWLNLTVRDEEGRTTAEERLPVEIAPPEAPPPGAERDPPPPNNHSLEQTWQIPAAAEGYYGLECELGFEAQLLVRKRYAFVRVSPSQPGEGPAPGYGWSFERPLHPEALPRMLPLVRESGIRVAKYPVWRTLEDPAESAQTLKLIDELGRAGIRIVGVLSDPPLPRDSGVDSLAELFALPQDKWAGTIHPVLARYSSVIRDWQVGADLDGSFAESEGFAAAYRKIRGEIQRIGRGATVGVYAAAGTRDRIAKTERIDFVAIPLRVDGPAVVGGVVSQVLTPDSVGPEEDAPTQRRDRLVMLLLGNARRGGGELVFGPAEQGSSALADSRGNPTPLYLPWRTSALSLAGRAYGGSFSLEGGSENALFCNETEATLFLWGDRPRVERMRLSGGWEATFDGRRHPLPRDPATGDVLIETGPTPRILRQLSTPLMRWQLSTGYEKGRVRSESGLHEDAIVGQNTFSQGVQMTVVWEPPAGWDAERKEWKLKLAAGEKFRCPFSWTLPADANLGDHPSHIRFHIDGETNEEIRVFRPYRVGIDQIRLTVTDRILPDGRLEIVQVLNNSTQPVEPLDFRCQLYVPGRRRQKAVVTRLESGTDRKVYYLPDGESYRGQKMWLRLDQEGGKMILNHHWVVGGGEESGGATPGTATVSEPSSLRRSE